MTNDTNRAMANDRTKDHFNITNAGIPERVVANQRNDVYDMSCSNDDLDEQIKDAIVKRGERGRTNDKKKVRFMKDKTIKAIDTILYTNNTKPYEQLTLNKNFVSTQFNDAYRDVMTAINMISPNQKQLFNIQTLPVVSTLYDPKKEPPLECFKLVIQFIKQLNMEIKNLPESQEIVNDYNNYLPLTSQTNKYIKDKGVNQFYNEIGVDFNLYADTPINAPVELIKILETKQEFTEAETKYVISFVIKKILKSIEEQMKITVHFILENDPLEGENLFSTVENTSFTRAVAVEYVFIDGYFTNKFDVNFECYGKDNNKINTPYTDFGNYYNFSDLGKNSMTSNHQVITELNKKYREHELEMNNMNVNIPYPIYQNPEFAQKPDWS
jgi:hypothetical protein